MSAYSFSNSVRSLQSLVVFHFVSLGKDDDMTREEVESHRLFNCARCGHQVKICRRCDRGNRFCSATCRDSFRRQSVREAGARYQRTERGAARNAERQRLFREREKISVTHQCDAAPSRTPETQALPFRLRQNAPPIKATSSKVPTCSLC